MGSWNATCGLTSLPIRYEDEVYIFPVVEQDHSIYRSHCNTHAFYKPSIVPFVGVYEDCGQAHCSGVSLEYTIDGIKAQLIEKIEDPVGGRKLSDVIRKDFNIDHMFSAIHEKKLQSSFSKNGNIFISMVHKPIADSLFIDYQFDAYVGSLVEGNYLRRVNYYKLFKIFMNFIEEYKEDIKTTTSPFGRIFSKERVGNNPHYVVLSRKLSPTLTNDYNYCHEMFDVNYVISDMIKNDDKNLEEMIRLFCIGCMVNDIMGETRKVWMPNLHEGSQNCNYDIYLKLNNAVDNFITDKKEQENEDYWDDDD